MLGFVPERVYPAVNGVLNSVAQAPGFGMQSYAQTLQRGLRNDVSTVFTACSRPLDSEPMAGAATQFWQNRTDFRGTGPDARVFPRLVYSVHGSQYGDKKLTIAAAHPNTSWQATSSASSAATQAMRLTVPRLEGGDYGNDLVASITSTDSARVVTALGIDAAGTNYRPGDLVVVDDSNNTGSAIARVSTVDAASGVTGLTLLYSGAGDTEHDLTEACFKLNAQSPLRIVDGSEPSRFADNADNGRDVSRVIVQSACCRESLNTAAGAVAYRSLQSCFGFAPGDVVVLGDNTSLLLGSINHGASVSGLRLTITRVTDSGEILEATGAVSSGAGHNKLFSGQYYRVLQGDCKTVIRLTSSPGAASTSFTFVVAMHGTGHFRGTGVLLMGPIVPGKVTGVVEEVMQPNFRNVGAVSNLESAFLMRLTSDAWNVAPASYHRDGSLLKVRLPFNCRYVVHEDQTSIPGALLGMSLLAPSRFQILNESPNALDRFTRSDTVWHVFGAGTSDSLVASTLKMPYEWDLNVHAGIVVTLHKPLNNVSVNNTLVVNQTVVNNVLARITYNASVARSWGVAHTKAVDVQRVSEISIRLRTRDLRDDYQLNGGSFSIGFNFYSG